MYFHECNKLNSFFSYHFRHWSKKYPICIILNESEKIQVLEKEISPSEKKDPNRPDEKKKQAESSHDVESTETNTSPEKKKKFVWRRRDKRGTLEKEGRLVQINEYNDKYIMYFISREF